MMFRRVVVISLLLAAAGCARVRTVGVDYQANQITVCGSRRATLSHLYRGARRSCNDPAPLRCGEELRGVHAFSPGPGSIWAVPVHGKCCVFQCR
jgi:hypothetical protein